MKGLRMTAAVVALVALAAAASGCVTHEENARYMAGQFRAQADLRTSAGADAGKAIAEQVEGGIRVLVEAQGLPSGPHGAHVHMVGRCDAPGFESAGSHWNPTGHQHGTRNPAGPHAGDMPNLEVAADGRGRLTVMLPSGTFEGLLDEDGSAMMIHAGPDDLRTDPSGNSGGRIACGVFQAM